MKKRTVAILNDSAEKKTVAGLRAALKNATGKTRAKLHSLLRGLGDIPQPAGRASTAKGAVMATKKHKGTGHKKPHAHKNNPTFSGVKAKAKHFAAKARSVSARYDIKGIAIDAAGVVGGQLLQSLVQKQVKNLTGMSDTVSGLISGGIIAGAGFYFGKGSHIVRSVAVGALASAIRSVAASAAPQFFAGADDEELGANPEGYWDPTTGEFVSTATLQGVDDEDGMGSLYYMRGRRAPHLKHAWA